MTELAQSPDGPAAPVRAPRPEWAAYLTHRGVCPQCAQTTYLCLAGAGLLAAARTPLGPCTSCGEPVYAGEEQLVVVRGPEATTRELVHRAPCKGPPAAATGPRPA